MRGSTPIFILNIYSQNRNGCVNTTGIPALDCVSRIVSLFGARHKELPAQLPLSTDGPCRVLQKCDNAAVVKTHSGGANENCTSRVFRPGRRCHDPAGWCGPSCHKNPMDRLQAEQHAAVRLSRL